MKRAGIAFALLAAGTGIEADAADALELSRPYYRIEVVLFERPVAGPPGNEQLTIEEPPEFPRGVQAFASSLEERAAAFSDIDENLRPFPGEPRSRVLEEDLPPVPVPAPAPGTPASATAAEPLPPPKSPEERARELLQAFEADLLERSFAWLPATALELGRQAQRIDRAPGFHVLLHGAWIQPVPDRDNEPVVPLLIQTGDPLDGTWPAEGTFSVTLGRYLHFEARLWFRTAAALVPETVPTPMPGLPETVSPIEEPVPPWSDAPPAPAYMALEQTRRMRSGELNYLDHPKYGLLVRIDPVEPPEELTEPDDAQPANP